MAGDDDLITQLRIDLAVQKAKFEGEIKIVETKLESSAVALKLAHANTIAWIMAAASITALIFTLLRK